MPWLRFAHAAPTPVDRPSKSLPLTLTLSPLREERNGERGQQLVGRRLFRRAEVVRVGPTSDIMPFLAPEDWGNLRFPGWHPDAPKSGEFSGSALGVRTCLDFRKEPEDEISNRRECIRARRH